MCKLYVGDVVKRITYNNGDSAQVGQLAVVLRVDINSVVVKYKGVDEEMWLSAYAALVQRKPLTPVNSYTFKVGDKGLAKGGAEYEIVAEAGEHLVALVSESPAPIKSFIVNTDGTFRDWPHTYYLLPPKRILYGMEAVFSNTHPNAPRCSEVRITKYNSDAHRKQDIAGMTGQGLWTIVRQWEEEA